jgi:DMATS type aromatic prenyltransferase
MSVNACRKPAGLSFFDVGVSRLSRLCEASGFKDRAPEILNLFHRLMSPWGQGPMGHSPDWLSLVADDHTPFEFSLGLGASSELRILVEPLGNAPSLRSNRDLSLELLGSLATDFSLDLDRLRRVEDLFLPPNPKGQFALWIAVGFSERRPPQFKIYLDPEAHGKRLTRTIVEEALTRLGFTGAWPYVGQALIRRGPDLDDLNYFSLDLARSPEARVKVYARHQRATTADLEVASSASTSYRAGDVTQFLAKLVPDGPRPFAGRSPQTCYAFVQGHARPVSATLHFPVNGYASDDRAIEEGVLGCLESFELSPDIYRNSVAAFAIRPLASGIGMQSYVSFKRQKGQPRFNVYFPVEAFAPGVVAKPHAASPRSGVTEIACHFERRESVTHHPFLCRLRREQANFHHLWKVIANFQVAMSNDFNFVGRFVDVVARVEDKRVRGILAKQFNDAICKSAGPHVDLVSNMLRELEAWRPAAIDESVIAPGRRFEPRIAEIMSVADVHESVGAAMAGAVLGQQMMSFFLEQFGRFGNRKKDELVPQALRPKTDSNPPDLSARIAELIPADSLEGLWRGEDELARAAWTFLDELYAHCYGEPESP